MVWPKSRWRAAGLGAGDRPEKGVKMGLGGAWRGGPRGFGKCESGGPTGTEMALDRGGWLWYLEERIGRGGWGGLVVVGMTTCWVRVSHTLGAGK